MSSMPHVVLAIEASTAKGSVALFRDQSLRQRRDVPMGASRDDALFPAIQDVLQSESLSPSEIDAIVCGGGPGSFTSLRIAGALAKGLAHATGARLFAVSSLLLSAAAHRAETREFHEQFVVHSDALRGERYTLVVSSDRQGNVQAVGDLSRLDLTSLSAFANGRPMLSVLGETQSEAEYPVVPDAGALMHVWQWEKLCGVDLNSWEPAYGRLAEAQVKWEAAHQQPLPAT